MNKRIRWILVAAVLVILVILSSMMSDSGIEVETELIGHDTLMVMVTEEGRTRVRDRYTVAAPIAGRLARIEMNEGDVVKTGDLIARIFPLPEGTRSVSIAQAQVKAAEARGEEAAARVEEAQARAEQLEREIVRRRTLAQDSILSQEEIERDELAAISAQRQLEAARATLLVIEAEKEAASAVLIGANPQEVEGKAVLVRAPSAGRVLRVLEESERVLMAGTPLIVIGSAEGLEVVVDVLSEDAVRIQSGDVVLITDWGGESLQGRVRMVEPDAFTEVSALGVEEQRVNVIVDLFDPPAALGSGYRVEANIVTWMGTEVLTVPTSALFQQRGVWNVFVVADGEARLQSTRIGHRAVDAAEVLEGLEAQDEVILFPSDQIADGVSVQSNQN